MKILVVLDLFEITPFSNVIFDEFLFRTVLDLFEITPFSNYDRYQSAVDKVLDLFEITPFSNLKFENFYDYRSH